MGLSKEFEVKNVPPLAKGGIISEEVYKKMEANSGCSYGTYSELLGKEITVPLESLDIKETNEKLKEIIEKRISKGFAIAKAAYRYEIFRTGAESVCSYSLLSRKKKLSRLSQWLLKKILGWKLEKC